jgi:hypothetical protein
MFPCSINQNDFMEIGPVRFEGSAGINNRSHGKSTRAIRKLQEVRGSSGEVGQGPVSDKKYLKSFRAHLRLRLQSDTPKGAHCVFRFVKPLILAYFAKRPIL